MDSLEERIADLIGSRYWKYGIGKSDEWCRKLAMDIVDLIDQSAELSRVQLNSTQGHTRDKTAPNAQQMNRTTPKVLRFP